MAAGLSLRAAARRSLEWPGWRVDCIGVGGAWRLEAALSPRKTRPVFSKSYLIEPMHFPARNDAAHLSYRFRSQPLFPAPRSGAANSIGVKRNCLPADSAAAAGREANSQDDRKVDDSVVGLVRRREHHEFAYRACNGHVGWSDPCEGAGYRSHAPLQDRK